MLKKYLLVFLISMVPLIELRGGVPVAMGMDMHWLEAIVVCGIGNMLPVPVIYLFARKVLLWGMDKPVIGPFFRYCVEKGQLPGHGLQDHHRRGFSGCGDGRHYHGGNQLRRAGGAGILNSIGCGGTLCMTIRRK